MYVPRDFRTGESRGFGFVRYYNKEEAERALEKLDGKVGPWLCTGRGRKGWVGVGHPSFIVHRPIPWTAHPLPYQKNKNTHANTGAPRP